eukprot:GHVN01019598.1.p1 GENE.GHVN01019598.1~~GHVN01019598.1.p1  ORF type:complete len:1678 (-),score=279.07 GHVN01019598.1:366-5399(-)
MVEAPPPPKSKAAKGDLFGAPTVTRAACGLYHSLCVTVGGVSGGDIPQLSVWGRNDNNCLAMGADVIEVEYPVNNPVFSKNHVYQVSCGTSHSCVLIKRADEAGGKLYSFGHGNRGRLGYTKTTEEEAEDEEEGVGPTEDAWFSPKPIRIRFDKTSKSKIKIARVSCGADHSLAISDNGVLFGWGVGQYGAIGNGGTDDTYLPRRIKVGNKGIPVAHCSAGTKHSLACTDTGEAYAWGNGANGRLGLGHARGSLTPTLVEHLLDRNTVFVSAGESHSAFVDTQGLMFTCGAGTYGRLGHSATDDGDVMLPRLVEGLGGVSVAQVACGTFHNLALTTDGRLYSWGAGLGCGILSEMDQSIVPIPVHVQSVGNEVCQIAVGPYHSIAISFKGDVSCWGVTGQCRLGHGNDERNEPYPRVIAELRNKGFVRDLRQQLGAAPPPGSRPATAPTGDVPVSVVEQWRVVQVACGDDHTAVVTAVGQCYVWGSNAYGQLGLGEQQDEDSYEPTKLDRFNSVPIRKVACGSHHTVCLSQMGDVFVCGSNHAGQLGLGVVGSEVFNPTVVSGVNGVIEVAACEDYTACVVGADQGYQVQVGGGFGALFTWGSAETGKLGHGPSMTSGCCAAPKQVIISAPIGGISCGQSHMFALTPNGEVLGWGSGYYGRLGLGSNANSYSPSLVSFPVQGVVVVAVSCGDSHSVFLTAAGDVWVCGKASSVCSTSNVMSPQYFTQIESQDGVAKVNWVCCAADHTFALSRSDGLLWGFGDNSAFQLGLGSSSAELLEAPEICYNLPDKVEVMGTGRKHAVAFLKNGEMYAWGDAKTGKLGIGYQKKKMIHTPSPVVTTWAFEEGGEDDAGGVESYGVHGWMQEEGLTLRAVDAFIKSLEVRSAKSKLPAFGDLQTLLLKEKVDGGTERLLSLENDLIKILGRYLDRIVGLDDEEREVRRYENEIDMRLAAIVGQVKTHPPERPETGLPTSLASKMGVINDLITILQIQPAYLARLAFNLRGEFELGVYVSFTKHLFEDISNKRITFLYLSLCRAVCNKEVESATLLHSLFDPTSSIFYTLFTNIALSSDLVSEYGRMFLDVNSDQSVAHLMASYPGTVSLDLEHIAAALRTNDLSDPRVKQGFHQGLQILRSSVLRAVSYFSPSLTSNLSYPIIIPQPIRLLLRCAYHSIVERHFQLGFSPSTEQTNVGGFANVQDESWLMAPVVRLLLQGVMSKLFRNARFFASQCRFTPISGQLEANLRTLGLFLDFGYRDGFSKLPTAYLLNQILTEAVHATTEPVKELSNVPDVIQTELTVAVYTDHFDTAPQYVALKASDLANIINLLRAYLPLLQLSAFDPVASIVDDVSEGANPAVSDVVVDECVVSNLWINFKVKHRFLLTDKNMVFDTETLVPVPQRLATRQRAAAHDSVSVVSIISRYIAPDVSDPRLVIENALRIAPRSAAGKLKSRSFAQLREELLVIRELFSSTNPPMYEKAAATSEAIKRCDELAEAQFPAATTMRWVAEHIKKRLAHKQYLDEIYAGEIIIRDAQAEYNFHIERKLDEMRRFCDCVKMPEVESSISDYAHQVGAHLKFDRFQDHRRRHELDDDFGMATGTIAAPQLMKDKVITHTVYSNRIIETSIFTFTALEYGGWRMQFITRSEDGFEKTAGEEEVDEKKMDYLRWLPGGSEEPMFKD